MKANCVVFGKEFEKLSTAKTCGEECSLENYRAARREINRKYGAANAEKERERQRQYRAANAEKIRESRRKYRAANAEYQKKAQDVTIPRRQGATVMGTNRFIDAKERDMAKKRAPKMPAPKASKTIQVRLDLAPKDDERLERQAEKRGMDKPTTVRMVIMEWLAEQERGSK